MNETTLFLGESFTYWMELKRRIDSGESFESSRLLNEVIELRGKVNFYESRIKEMAMFVGTSPNTNP